MVDNISKTYPGGITALSRVSLEVHRQELVVVIGPSGSGKSTFLRCLNGIEETDSGSIFIDGIPLDFYRLLVSKFKHDFPVKIIHLL